MRKAITAGFAIALVAGVPTTTAAAADGPAPVYRHHYYDCVDAAGSPVDNFSADYVGGYRPRLVVDSTKVFQVWYAATLSGTVLRDMPDSRVANANLPMVTCITNSSLFVEVLVIGSFAPVG
jgi:hypothetical protein